MVGKVLRPFKWRMFSQRTEPVLALLKGLKDLQSIDQLDVLHEIILLAPTY
jgi:hypothetical protein